MRKDRRCAPAKKLSAARPDTTGRSSGRRNETATRVKPEESVVDIPAVDFPALIGPRLEPIPPRHAVEFAATLVNVPGAPPEYLEVALMGEGIHNAVRGDRDGAIVSFAALLALRGKPSHQILESAEKIAESLIPPLPKHSVN